MERVVNALLTQDIPKNLFQIALHLTAAKLLGDKELVELCVKKMPKLLRSLAQSLEGKTWPEDWEECLSLRCDYAKVYGNEWVKERVETASHWLKETKSWLESKKW